MGPLRHPPFLVYLGARFFSEFSYQIAAVVIGWQIYALTHSAFDLGMAGLVQFAPTALLVFVTGSAADRFSRRRVMQACQIAQGARSGVPGVGKPRASLDRTGDIRSDRRARRRRCVRKPRDGGATLRRHRTQHVTARRRACVGRIAVRDDRRPRARRTALRLLARGAVRTDVRFLGGRRDPQRLDRRHQSVHAPPRESRTFRELWAGVAFIRSEPAILGAISLDLFAVLFGGATALLPIYAHDILRVGPLGLGSCAPHRPSARS